MSSRALQETNESGSGLGEKCAEIEEKGDAVDMVLTDQIAA